MFNALSAKAGALPMPTSQRSHAPCLCIRASLIQARRDRKGQQHDAGPGADLVRDRPREPIEGEDLRPYRIRFGRLSVNHSVESSVACCGGPRQCDAAC